MTGIAEEVVLHQTHFVLQLLSLLPVVGIEYTCHYSSKQQQQGESAPYALPEGRAHLNRYFCNILAPYSVGVGG